MLLSFKVANYLSFDTPVTFDMTAAKDAQHSTRVARENHTGERILQAAAVFGGNAAGKSNLCKALTFARNLIVSGTKADGTINRSPFKLRGSAASLPSEFEFKILVGEAGEEQIYKYTLMLSSREVLFESLIQIRSASEKTLYTRNATGGEHSFTLDWSKRRECSDEDRQFAKFVARGTRRNQPFLTEAADRNLKYFKPVMAWFREQLMILEPEAEYLSLETLDENRQELRDYVASMLSRADTGIVAVAAEPVPIESTGLPTVFREQLMTTLKEGGTGMLLRSVQGQRFSIYLLHGELKAAKVKLYRKSVDSDIRVPFDVSEESDGTMRMFDLSPLFHDLVVKGARRTYIVDELDRSMHTALTKNLLEYYLQSRSTQSRGQLIVTLHDTELLSQKLFRRDELWIAERDACGATRLTRVSNQKKLRHDKDLRKGYLEGDVAGLPAIGFKDEFIQPNLF